MTLSITFLGHSGFVLSDGTHTVALDPFLTGNPVAQHKPADIHCQWIALTHGHGDHLGDSAAIARANRATVLANYEICEFLGSQGCQTDPGNTGGQIKTDFGFVAFTPAFHSSSVEGRYLGQPGGLIVNMGGLTFYHCGDTAIFSDMKLIGEIYRPDIAAIPIGDRYTMGPDLASRAADMIRPRWAIPIHYKTFPGLAQSAAGFKPSIATVKELQPGETWQAS
ncbi:MAG: metal-dependent hydrolase [Phycisphaeraceae bacterium]|nr:metal-dependent hydrolase [Phycisphaeraceae bacterium]